MQGEKPFHENRSVAIAGFPSSGDRAHGSGGRSGNGEATVYDDSNCRMRPLRVEWQTVYARGAGSRPAVSQGAKKESKTPGRQGLDLSIDQQRG